MASYVDPEAFKASTSIIGNFSEADVDMALAASSRAVEHICHRRTFFKETVAVARQYTARTSTRLTIDDTWAITSVSVNGVEVTGYTAEPLNAIADGRPYTSLTAVSSLFDTSRPGANEVMGKPGWPAVPEQVPQMVSILAAKLLKRTREAPFGIVTVGGLEGSALRMATTDPDLKLLCGPLKRQLVGWR